MQEEIGKRQRGREGLLRKVAFIQTKRSNTGVFSIFMVHYLCLLGSLYMLSCYPDVSMEISSLMMGNNEPLQCNVLGPDSAKQGSIGVCTHRFASFSQAFVIFGSKANSSPINNNTVGSLSDIYHRKAKLSSLRVSMTRKMQ